MRVATVVATNQSKNIEGHFKGGPNPLNLQMELRGFEPLAS